MSQSRLSKSTQAPARLQRLELPERAPIAGTSARRADIELLAKAPADFLDSTHFDTVRFPPPPWAAEQFGRAAGDGTLAYTGYRGNAEVLSVLAGSVGRFLDLPLDPQQNLILTPGTQAGLFASLASLIEDGDRVALIDPDYLFSARILRFLGADIGHVPLLFAPDGPCPDLDALDTEFKRKGARYLVFSHPNNPAGAVFSAQTIARIARLANTYDITVLVDELYSRLLHDGCSFPHLASQPEMFARTVTLLGQSKTESLSGYRLGVVVAPPEIISRVENVLSIMALRAPAYAQHVLLPWLRDDHDWLARRLKEFTALRTLTVESLCRLPWLKLQPQAGTAYVWPDVSALGLPGPEIAAALLCEAGVLVSPGYQFVHGDIIISNPLVLTACALDGMGPALLANWLVDEALGNGTLVDPFPGYAVSATDFETAAWLLYPSRAYLPNKVRVMIDFLRKSFTDKSQGPRHRPD